MSNSDEFLKRVAISCPNLGTDQELHHIHVPLDSGRARRCQVYPRAFGHRVCEGFAANEKLRRLGVVSMPLMSLESHKANGEAVSDALHNSDGMQVFDGQSGDPLVPGASARRDKRR